MRVHVCGSETNKEVVLMTALLGIKTVILEYFEHILTLFLERLVL